MKLVRCLVLDHHADETVAGQVTTIERTYSATQS